MDIGSFLLILSVLLLTAMFVAKPLLDKRAGSVSELESRHSSLLAQREQVLTILQELDFDYNLGKIQDDDYAVQRRQLLVKGSETLMALEALETAIRKSRPKVSDAVERAIADRRAAAASGPKQPLVADDDLERMIAARKRDRSEKSAGFCPQCGQAIQQSDKFCSKCGATIA